VARACGGGRPRPLSQPQPLILVEQCDRADWLASRAPHDDTYNVGAPMRSLVGASKSIAFGDWSRGKVQESQPNSCQHMSLQGLHDQLISWVCA